VQHIRELVEDLGLSNEEATDIEGQHIDASGVLTATAANSIIGELTERLARKSVAADA
jgi:hypothetical protein